jgi:hypothetical protein
MTLPSVSAIKILPYIFVYVNIFIYICLFNITAMCIPVELKQKKALIEQEFLGLNLRGATLEVTPVLPDKLHIDIQVNEFNRKSKTIHHNEKTWFKELLRFHCLI